MSAGNDVLSPATREIDRALVEIDREIDWLFHLSPQDNHKTWNAFREARYEIEPKLRYPDIRIDLDGLRSRLLELPVAKVERPRVAALLRAKQRELDLQLELLRLRETEGFIAASIDLFGDVEVPLCREARTILDTVEPEAAQEHDADARVVLEAAEQEMARYREVAPDFWCTAEIVNDLNSMMMVNHGHMLIDRHTALPSARVPALIAHEVGIHIVTRYNGYCQPLRLLEAGTAHYDPLQEGLGVFAEYLSGCLPPSRLRTLAARVMAADAAIERKSVCDIFAMLHEEYAIDPHEAFDTAVRAKRGGGLTKDACYLRGLRDLLTALSEEEFGFFLIGKFDLEHRHLIHELQDMGTLKAATILPSFLNDDDVQRRLSAARDMRVVDLVQGDPAP